MRKQRQRASIPTKSKRALPSLPGMEEAGHFHAWMLTEETIVAAVQVSPLKGTDELFLPPLFTSWLIEHWNIDQFTVQVDLRGELLAHHGRYTRLSAV